MPPKRSTRCGGARLMTQAAIENRAYLKAVANNMTVLDAFIEEDSTRILLAPATVKNRKLTVRKYFEFVEEFHPAFAEQPFAGDGLVARMQQFMSVVAEGGRSGFQNTGTQKQIKMTLNTLRTLTWSCHFMLVTLGGLESGGEWTVALQQTAQGIRDRLNVVDAPKTRQIFLYEDISFFAEKLLDKPRSYAFGLSRTLLLLLMYYCGCRVGSLLPSSCYKHHFLTFADISFRRRPGVCRFGMVLTLRWFKGHQAGSFTKSIRYNLEPTASLSNVHLDSALIAMALLFRLGAFGERTFEDLLYGEEAIIECSRDMSDYPLFQCGLPAGYGTYPSPLFTIAAHGWFESFLRRHGLQTDGYSFYSFRHSLARRLTPIIGADNVRALMGHRSNSTTLCDVYAAATEGVDVTALGLPDQTPVDAAEMRKAYGSGMRYRLDKSDLSLTERVTEAHALEFDPAYRRISELLNDLLPHYMAYVVESADDGEEIPDDLVPDGWRSLAPAWAALKPQETLSTFYIRVQTSLFYRLRRLNEIVQKGVRRKIFEKLREAASLEDQEASLEYARKSGARIFNVVTNEQASIEQKVARLADLGITTEEDLRAFSSVTGAVDCTPFIDPSALTASADDRQLSEAEHGAARARFFQGLCTLPDESSKYDRVCLLCVDDPYVSNPHKLWPCKFRVARHQRGETHSDYNSVIRAVEGQYLPNGTKWSYYRRCPICPIDPVTADNVKCIDMDGVSVSSRIFRSKSIFIEHVVHVHLHESSVIGERERDLFLKAHESGQDDVLVPADTLSPSQDVDRHYEDGPNYDESVHGDAGFEEDVVEDSITHSAIMNLYMGLSGLPDVVPPS